MAETKYEIGLLNYTCDTYESAIEFLDNFGKHKPGQPICVLYGEEGNLKALFAVGTEAGDGYDIVGSVNTNDIARYVKWFTLDENGNPVPDQNQLRLIHNLPDDFDLDELSNGSNLLFIPVNDEIGYIYHNGILYASPYIEDKITKGELTVGETTYEEGTPLTDIIVDILGKIDPDNIKVKWENITGKPEKVEDAFNCSSFLKKENNLSELLNKQLAARNLLIWDGMVNNTILKIENGEIKWGNVTIGWYHGDDPIPGTEVRFVKMSKAEYEALTSPSIYKLYFVDAGGGTFELFLGPYPIKPTSYNIYKNPNPPSDLQEQYMLLDSGGNICGSTIDIPKDKFVTHAELKTVTEPDVPYEGAKVGDEYIDLEVMYCEDHIYIPLGDLDVPQSDWGENDPTSPTHILNRTHWTDEPVEEEVIVAEYTGGSDVNIPLNEPLVAGKTYTVVSSGYPDEQYNYTMEIPVLYYESGDYFEIPLRYGNFQSIEGIDVIRLNGPTEENANIVIKYTKTTQEIHSLSQEYIQNPLVDWGQSDPTGAGYVKNRTHYDDGGYDDVIGKTLTFNNSGNIGGAYFFDPLFEPKEGEIYYFKIGNYLQKLNPMAWYENNGLKYLSCSGGNYWGGGTYFFFPDGNTDPNSGAKRAVVSPGGNPNFLKGQTFNLLRKKADATKPLDKKYIPAGASDWNQNDPTRQGYVENRTHYEKITDEEYAVFEGTFTVDGSSWTIPEEHITDYKLWETGNVGYNLFVLEIDGIRYGRASTYISNTVAYGGGNALYDPTENYGDVSFGSFSFGTNGSGFNAYFYFYASGTNINPATQEPIFDPNETHSYKFYGIKTVKNIKEIEGKYLPAGSTYVEHVYDGDFRAESGDYNKYIYFNLDKEYGLKDAIFTVNFLGTEYKLKFTNIYTYTGDYHENMEDWYGSTQYIYFDPNNSNSYFYIYYTSAFSTGDGYNAYLYISKNRNTTYSGHATVDVEYVKVLNGKYLPQDMLSKSIICNTSISSLDISNVVVPKDAKSITVESTSHMIMSNIFNGDGSYQRNGNNPGLNIPSRRMVEYNGYIYWVGGENDINIYRTPTSGTQSETIWKTLDSTKFTSTFSIVWISGYLVVAGNASHLAFISLSTGEITYTQLNETNTKYYWVGLDAVDQNTWAISTGWGNYNTLAVMTSDGLKQITPLKIYGFKFIDDVLWITHQGGFGIGTYNYGLSKLDLNNLEQGFVNVLNFSTTDIYGNIYTIGKFPINFFIEEMRNALYIVSWKGYMRISKDGGETWSLYSLGTSSSQTVTKLATRSDGTAYIFTTTSYGITMYKLTGLNGTNFSKSEMRNQSTTQNYSFPVPVQNGISFNYLYKEYMGQNRYSDTALYYYDFDYYSKYKSILNQSGSYDSNKYIIIENLIVSDYTYYNVLCKVRNATTTLFNLELYSGPNEILLIVDSPTWPRNNGNVGFYSAKKNQYAGVEWSFDLYNGEAEAISERTLLATDEEIDEICQ